MALANRPSGCSSRPLGRTIGKWCGPGDSNEGLSATEAFRVRKFHKKSRFGMSTLIAPFRSLAMERQTTNQPDNNWKTEIMKTQHAAKRIHHSPVWRKLLLITPMLVIFAMLTAVPARATTPCALGSQTLAVGHFSNGLLNLKCNEFDQFGWFLKMNVKGDSDLYVVRNSWPVGAHSGWHTHPGPSLITVLSGELTVYNADDPMARVFKSA